MLAQRRDFENVRVFEVVSNSKWVSNNCYGINLLYRPTQLGNIPCMFEVAKLIQNVTSSCHLLNVTDFIDLPV